MSRPLTFDLYNEFFATHALLVARKNAYSLRHSKNHKTERVDDFFARLAVFANHNCVGSACRIKR